MPQNKISFSNILLLLSIFFTGLTFVFDNIYIFGMHRGFLDEGLYHLWGVQFFTSQFIHGDILHLLFNGIFIFYFGNILETIIGYKKMLFFFLGNTAFVGLALTFLGGGGITVGISGFALAILTYYTLLLWKNNNPEYTGGITAIVINILIGISPGVSFLGHFAGMMFGGIFFCSQYIIKKK